MTASLAQYLTNRLQALQLPSLFLYTAVVSVPSKGTTLDAMRLMSEDGVSSVAVLEEGSGRLLSAVSVTDVGKVTGFLRSVTNSKSDYQVVLPTQSNQILTTEMHQLISIIRVSFIIASLVNELNNETQDPFGSTDGEEHYPGWFIPRETRHSLLISASV
jgi:CBS-domain-containing membrane protein